MSFTPPYRHDYASTRLRSYSIYSLPKNSFIRKMSNIIISFVSLNLSLSVDLFLLYFFRNTFMFRVRRRIYRVYCDVSFCFSRENTFSVIKCVRTQNSSASKKLFPIHPIQERFIVYLSAPSQLFCWLC